MSLTLRAVSLNDLPLTQPITAQFGAQGGTIGRADQNTLALPDPERHISRQQAEIRVGGAGYLISNIGSANPITVAGQPLHQGQTLPLRHRDEVRIGGYLLQVSDDGQEADTNIGAGSRPVAPPAPSVAPGMQGRGPAPAPGGFDPLAGNPFDGLAGFGLGPGGGGVSANSSSGMTGSNPFADLLGGAPVSAPTAAPAMSAFGQTHLAAPPPAPATNPGMGLLPDDFDPFAPPPAPASARSTGPAPSPFDRPSSAATPSADPFGASFGTPVGAASPAGAPFQHPFDAPRSAPAPRPAQQGAFGDLGLGGGGAFADLIPSEGSGGGSIDDLFGLKPGAGSGGDPLAGFMAEAAKSVRDSANQTMPSDPLALFGLPGTAPTHSEPSTPALPDHTSALNASFRPPEVRRPSPPAEAPVAPTVPAMTAPAAAIPAHDPLADFVATVPPPLEPAMVMPSPAVATPPVAPVAPPVAAAVAAPAAFVPPASAAVAPPPMVAPPAATAAVPSAAAGAQADTAALWNAFCEGAGLRFEPPQGLNPDLMRVIGQLLHSSVDGALQMMAVRAATKHELRAQVTVIRSRDNNPLKFSPDAQSAMEQLLQPPVRGFLPGPAAMADAMHDLVGHTIGTMAGTRAALEGVLSRFKPEMLESKLTSRSMLDSVLTLNRKAKLWELYLTHFESIREEAQEDFHNLFGKAFLEAYEEQLERLNQRKSAA
ncbi:type VI secretion system-associated FHA domain protein TagH [Roseateles amylovorans]|uniref:Type VI secretion system-associated FHA domain protein TagH n=1 Tax=Roseateles amylovorans TaxID=2978473 RepID=A0ABY6B7C0_9BURK|nr:type VI secretion system-associated FHA domain protein TagH [Roseateles amylovorans]UXH80666.1 type VI secretion system-associated FHA domain protein TagH [Roseateles amylovorans]